MEIINNSFLIYVEELIIPSLMKVYDLTNIEKLHEDLFFTISYNSKGEDILAMYQLSSKSVIIRVSISSNNTLEMGEMDEDGQFHDISLSMELLLAISDRILEMNQEIFEKITNE